MYIYIIPAVLTIVAAFAIINKSKKLKLSKMYFRQSSLHQLIKDALPTNKEIKNRNRQSYKHKKDTVLKVIRMPNNKAYWVRDNVFYCAEIKDGEPFTDYAKAIDTSELSKQELNELLNILDALQNG